MTPSHIADIPEPGQLVEVRQRRYVVSEVSKSALPPAPLSESVNGIQHLISLTSIEDDALGEELQVIWEIEPGARIYDQGNLPAPTGFDAPERLDAFLDAVRWGAASSADVRALQAPFRSGVDIEDYQLDPLVRAIQMPRVNLLIADDVGLGKTVETGLIAQELIIRHRVHRILVVCPAALQIHWRDQMRDKFGLEFRIVDAELMKELRRKRGIHANPWSHFPRLIASIDFLKRDRPTRLFRELLPAEGEPAYPRRFDLLIVDEAHNVAPQGRGRYATDSMRTAAIRMLAPHFEHRLFLTATPHNGYTESFSALLELIDNQRFARGVPPNEAQLRAIMVRRLKSELKDWDGKPLFPPRVLKAIPVDYAEEEKQVHRWLQEYTRLRQENVTVQDRYITEFVLKLLKKRLFSSPAAFAITLARHEQSLSAAMRRKPEARWRPSGILHRQLEQVEEDYAEDQAYEDNLGEAMATATALFRPLSPRERELLNKMRDWAERNADRADSKARALMAWLRENIKPGGKWSDERVIIFTEYRATQNWLHERLVAEGLGDQDHLQMLYGGMDGDAREKIKAAFQAHPRDSKVRILLATDAASEGIDLQNHCHRMVHLEIPWNPNRLEQRNGRIDRHGQQHSPLIYHFVSKGFRKEVDLALPPGELEGDLEFLMRVAIKVHQIRDDLGKVGPVIADQVEEAMLGRRNKLDTAPAELAAEPVRRLLKFERDLQAQIRRLHEQIEESRQTLHLTPENVQRVVEIALELAGQPRVTPAELGGVWPDPSGQRKVRPVFRMPPLSGSWARCTEGLAHPHTGQVRPIVFDHNLARGRDDVVLVHLGHPLAQMSMRLLRAEVWSAQNVKSLHRVTARVVPAGFLTAPAVIAHARLVITGGDSQRLHEEIIVAGGEIREGRFRRLNLGQVDAALRAATLREPSPELRQRLADAWPQIAPSLLASLDARTDERSLSLNRLLDERRDKEIGDITAVLQELEKTIRGELTEEQQHGYIQLELFSDSERDQYRRNVDALRHRLEQIPSELQGETKLIRDRFANPMPRMFPVAVTFLVPERLNG